MDPDRPNRAAATRGPPPPPSPADPGPLLLPARAWRRVLLLVVPIALLLVVVMVALTSGSGLQRWPEGTVHGPWRSVFDGGGFTGERDGVLVLEPARSQRPDETHASLVVSTASYGDLRYRVQTRTTEQLRRPAPNSWEVAWVLWHFTDTQHFYYLTLKPTGWELGKEDPAYPGSQRFLATGPPSYPVGPWYAVDIRQTGATASVIVDGRHLVDFTDTERPYLQGGVGAYTEDAHTEFRDASVRPAG
ncbi:family 16 glycoside hydrolase [Kitasatospora camelliae]|uniref:Family 16 glycoside hydrolase n=1 Tax=Kitasatospora camelliae TaxID=3156397 RepID=A0AAU8K133_9ACTN